MPGYIITQDHIIISRGLKRSLVRFEPNSTGNCSGLGASRIAFGPD